MEQDSGNRKLLRVYIAGPLFSDAERSFNSRLKRRLETAFEVFLPQEDGGLLVDMLAAGESYPSARKRVFEGDVSALRRTDLVIVVLDGRSVDEGAAFELGFAYALGKVCVGLQTDPRRLLPTGNNPMIETPLSALFTSVDDLVVGLPEIAPALSCSAEAPAATAECLRVDSDQSSGASDIPGRVHAIV